ncbi:hypothetical protein SAY87_014101 [Trapa incisa]|uniref:Uncharacterized protein n=1 Tax=Trapa incisa TaxID=236973 RepID=A0AAN7GJK5_9MYRT|nr:hypothetical protein SAY87_014101 [Trapa incisa]
MICRFVEFQNLAKTAWMGSNRSNKDVPVVNSTLLQNRVDIPEWKNLQFSRVYKCGRAETREGAQRFRGSE